MTADGLGVLGVSSSDEGEYTCRAEVEADGRYDERRIRVNIHGKLIACVPTTVSVAKERQTELFAGIVDKHFLMAGLPSSCRLHQLLLMCLFKGLFNGHLRFINHCCHWRLMFHFRFFSVAVPVVTRHFAWSDTFVWQFPAWSENVSFLCLLP